MKKKRKRSKQPLITGIAWYKPEQWERLRQVSSDSEVLEDRYEDWLELAIEKLEELNATGIKARRVEIDVEEWIAWCKERGKPLDAAARSEYVAERLQKEAEGARQSHV